jgi:hypothetical protein
MLPFEHRDGHIRLVQESRYTTVGIRCADHRNVGTNIDVKRWSKSKSKSKSKS